MKLKKFITLLLFVSLLSFVGCKSDDDKEPSSPEVQAEFQKELEDMDEFMGEMIQGSSAFSTLIGLSFIEDAPINLDLTNPLSIIGELENAFGTHTYVPDGAGGGSWLYSDQPSDEVIMIVPLTSDQSSTIRLYDFSISNTNVSFKLNLATNGVTSFTAAFTVMGNDLINPLVEEVITSASITGTITDQTGLTFNYDIDISNTSARMTFGAAGINALVINATGTNLMDTDILGEGGVESNINEISIKYRENIEIVIDDPQAESGDVGDVFYKGDKIGDLVVEAGEEGTINIVYTDGTEVELLSLLQNIGSLLTLSEGFLP